MMHLINHLGNKFIDDEEIVVLADPDQLFVTEVSGFEVSEGRPMAAQYSSGTAFLQWANDICEGHCDNVEYADELQIGAPYIVHAKDLKKIMPVWIKYMEEIRLRHSGEGGWLSDMYAYAIATLELNIRHNCLPMMVSSPVDSREPWGLVSEEDKQAFFVLHYCQKVEVGSYSWFKHDYRDQFRFTDCSFSDYLFPEIQQSQVQDLDGISIDKLPTLANELPKVNPAGQIISRDRLLLGRHVWLYQNIIPLANEAMKELRAQICPQQ
jgi:hypothetical protein